MKWISRLFNRKVDGQADESNEFQRERGPAIDSRSSMLAADNPITRAREDRLDRVKMARGFAGQVLTLDASQGVVVGVLGPWGSGKTSFVNLVKERFEEQQIQVLQFNPWMFSGAEQLVESFFIELAAQLRLKQDLSAVGERLEEYGEVFSGLGWLPLVGVWVERGRVASKSLATILKRRRQGSGAKRDGLNAALRALPAPLIVVLDDIDRLTSQEIRDIFRLVRLTACFPNVIYLVAFDRKRVEDALSDEGMPGRDYLEKILQVSVDLPAIANETLQREVFAALDTALGQVDNPGRLDEKAWPDVFAEIVWPLMRHMRDVRRYVLSVRFTVETVQGEVSLVDVLGLEAVRVFLPDVFQLMHGAVEGLTSTERENYNAPRIARLKGQIERLIGAADGRQQVVRAMIERLFPAGARHIGGVIFGDDFRGRWLKERRVAHEAVLRLYLETAAGVELRAFVEAERVWTRMTDRVEMDNYMRSLEVSRLRDIIAYLESFESEYTPEHVVPGAVVLLNVLPILPKHERSMFDFGSRMTVGRVVYRLVRALGDATAVETAVRHILPEVERISGRFELVRTVGHIKDVGHKLVTEAAARALEREIRDNVRAASVSDLVKEDDLAWLLLFTRRESGADEPPLEVDDSPELALALLRSSRSEALIESFGSRAVQRSPRLAWEALVEVYGSESRLRATVEILRNQSPEGCDELLQLAGKYSQGWRPEVDRNVKT